MTQITNEDQHGANGHANPKANGSNGTDGAQRAIDASWLNRAGEVEDVRSILSRPKTVRATKPTLS